MKLLVIIISLLEDYYLVELLEFDYLKEKIIALITI